MDMRRKNDATVRLKFVEEALHAAQTELADCREQARRTAHHLEERVKELSCLYSVASLSQSFTRPIAEVMRGVLNSLVAAYQYPDITCVRITAEGKTYCSENFRQSRWRQAVDLTQENKTIGAVEVFYREERPAADEGPFLKEERHLIDTVATLLAQYLKTRSEQEALDRRRQEFEALAERSPDVIVRVDRTLRTSYINPAIERFTDRPREWFLGKTAAELGLRPQERGLWEQFVQKVFESGGEQVMEHENPTAAGERYFHARVAPEFGSDGKVASVLVVDRDITELKRAQFALERLTLEDPMTGVANRRYLEQFIAREWGREARHRHPVAAIMADIDHFKTYNDCCGHQCGDDCLRRVAKTLKTQLRRPSDLVVRYGGDEFAIVMLETDLSAAARLAERIIKAIADLALPHEASPVASVVTVSLGVAAVPAHLTTFASLFSAADQALYRAKGKGRNRVEVAS